MKYKYSNGKLSGYRIEDIEELLLHHQGQKKLRKTNCNNPSRPTCESTFDNDLSRGQSNAETIQTVLISSILKDSKNSQMSVERYSIAQSSQILNLKTAADPVKKKQIKIINLPHEGLPKPSLMYMKNEVASNFKRQLIQGPSIEQNQKEELLMCRSELDSQNFSKMNLKNSKSVNSCQENENESERSFKNEKDPNSKLETLNNDKFSLYNGRLSASEEKCLPELNPNPLRELKRSRISKKNFNVMEEPPCQSSSYNKVFYRANSMQAPSTFLNKAFAYKKSNTLFPIIVQPEIPPASKPQPPIKRVLPASDDGLKQKRKQCCLFF
jgi:hypothetical protein